MAFRNYTEERHIAPRPVLIAGRITVLVATLALVGALAAGSRAALTLTWLLLIPLLPALWTIAPGLWRNLCPMAFLNQLPRELGFSRALSRPQPLRLWAYAISLTLLLGGIALRPILFNASPQATAALFGAALALALIGGIIFKGKSGWCGTFCPLAPVQKLYGQLAPVMLRNEYCSPCVGCQTNCYDFNPRAALPSDLYDRDQWSAGHRRFFAGMYPGFVAGYFLFSTYGIAGMLVMPLLTLGLFQTLRTFTKISPYTLVVYFGLGALCTYYAFTLPIVVAALHRFAGVTLPPQTPHIVWAIIVAGAVVAFAASIVHERLYHAVVAESSVAKIGEAGKTLKEHLDSTFLPEAFEESSGRRFAVSSKQTLLEAIEMAGLRIESGCRMGMCGADPIMVTDGIDRLSPPTNEERATLQRLGLGFGARLACSCHVGGLIQINIDPKTVMERCRGAEPPPAVVAERPSRRVVIIGNGTAGMSAAEHLRNRDEKAAITVVSDEPYHFYNRMGIGRLIYGRSAMSGLSLLEDSWYESHRVDVWLNTRAASLRPEQHEIELATGETIEYDSLIIATGACAAVPNIPGVALAGSFVLRNAADALTLRGWAQAHGVRRAAVVGAGVLGVEAADALRQLGVSVTLFARGPRVMERQLDEEAAQILRRFVERLGIDVRCAVEVAEIFGDERVRGVRLGDGEQVPCDLVVTCAGIAPNTEIAKMAGLEVRRGVVVDDGMRTSDASIYAVGDVAEHAGAISGLWPAAKKQGEIAAAAIVGEPSIYRGHRTMMHLKMNGIDVKCFGEIPQNGDQHDDISGSTEPDRTWRKLVIREGKLVGGVFIEEPEIAKLVAMVIPQDPDVQSLLPRLHAGDWNAFSSLTADVRA